MTMAYPEAVCLRRQMTDILVGKEITEVIVEDVTKHAGGWRFGSIDQSPVVFQQRLRRGEITGVESVANTLFLWTHTGHALALGYLSGNVRYHRAGETPAKKSCLNIGFSDGSALAVTISLWGLIRVLHESERQDYLTRWYGRVIEPNSPEYTLEGFRAAASQIHEPTLSVKKFLHAFEPNYYVSGIDSGYAQEILFRAMIHPKRRVSSLTQAEYASCYHSVNDVTREAIGKGGRASEVDLYGLPGGFTPQVCKETQGRPCQQCGTTITKFNFEGGTCYVCSGCQREEG